MIENLFYDLFPLIFVTIIIIFDKKIADFLARLEIKYDKIILSFFKKSKNWEKKTYKIYRTGFRIGVWLIVIITIYLFFDINSLHAFFMISVVLIKLGIELNEKLRRRRK